MFPVAGTRFVGRTERPAKLMRPTLLPVLALDTAMDTEPLGSLVTAEVPKASVVESPTAETDAVPP
jgi:hypothetical protein